VQAFSPGDTFRTEFSDGVNGRICAGKATEEDGASPRARKPASKNIEIIALSREIWQNQNNEP
jgi:hypothetical protein